VTFEQVLDAAHTLGVSYYETNIDNGLNLRGCIENIAQELKQVGQRQFYKNWVIDSIKYLVYIFLGLCNVLMVYSVFLKQSVGSSSFLDWLAYFGCLLGVFLAATGYHHLIYRMAHRQEFQGLVLGLIILMIPAWLSGFIVEMFLIISKGLMKDK
jgi:hypothetical protein